MKVEWDELKRAANLEKHGVDFTEVSGFEWDSAVIEPDTRKDYKEARFQAFAPIGDRLYVMVYTPRGKTIRIISFRKANSREVRSYVCKT